MIIGWGAFGLLLLVAIGMPIRGQAQMDRKTREIQHLMDYIARSDCRFIRNGKTYDAEAARAHIQKKYDYVRSRIRASEDFIRYAASQSSMSGEPYRIQCGQETVLCADWLREELGRYRQQE
jgi:hypothetical protein